MKLAKQATKRPNIVVFQGSFHGRTHMAMAMTTSKTVYRAGHAPLPGGVYVSPFPDPLASDQESSINAALTCVRPPAARRDRAVRDGRGDHRAGARRGWLRARAGSVHRGHRRALQGARHPLHRRRGAERVRSLGQLVRDPGLRRRARHHLHGQGHRLRLPVLGARHPPRARRPVAEGQPRRHLRRQPARVRGGARHDRGHERARLPRQRPGPRPATARRDQRADGGAPRHPPGARARA